MSAMALTDMGTGDLGMFAIGGERHSNGGTPLNLNPGSFIYSDTKKMKIKDPSFLAKYGKTKPVTPAKLVKPYLKMNDYKQVLEDQSADDIQKRTASRMIDTYKNKAAEIAFYQESMKGFPQGVPAVAQDYAQAIMGAAEMAYGGYVPKAQDGITLYPGGKTKQGKVTPTGKSNTFDRDAEYLYQWESTIPGVTKLSNKAAQEKIYDYMLQNEPDVIRNMWGTYGLTAKGKEDKNLLSKYKDGIIDPKNLTDEDLKTLKTAYADNYFGARQLDPLYQAPATPEAPKKEEPLVETTPKAVPAVPTINPADPNKTYAFQQDINNEAANLMNMLSERRYLPFAPQLPFIPADPTYMDDTRAQGMLAGQARSMAESLGAFAGPQQLASRISQISGASGEQAANIQAQLQQGNTSIANIFSERNAQMADATNRANLQTNVRAYDDTVKAMDTFDEKMRAYRTRAGALRNVTQSNKAKAELLNKLYPDFQINTMPGMYGNINVNPEALAAMQDPSKIADANAAAEAARQQQIREAFTIFPVEYDKEGKDVYASQRASLLSNVLKSRGAETASNPMLEYFKALQSQGFN